MAWSATVNIVGPQGSTATIDASNVGFNRMPTAYIAANYYQCNAPAVTVTTALPNNTIRVSPWVVTASITITRLTTEFTVAGNAGSVFRLGIWNDTGYGQPGTLLLDAGTIATTGTVGNKEITVSQALTPGLYWVGGAAQNAATTAPTMRGITNHYGMQQFLLPLGTTIPAAGAQVFAIDGGTASGAFANITTPTATSAAPRIGFKVT